MMRIKPYPVRQACRVSPLFQCVYPPSLVILLEQGQSMYLSYGSPIFNWIAIIITATLDWNLLSGVISSV